MAEVSKGATIKGYSEETENGKTTYEVEMMVHGHTKDVELDPSGAVVEIEEEAAMDSLPANVKAGLTAKAAGGKILKVETLTKGSKLVAYEAKVQSAAGKKSENSSRPGRQTTRSRRIGAIFEYLWQDSSPERLQHFFDGCAIQQRPHEELNPQTTREEAVRAGGDRSET